MLFRNVCSLPRCLHCFVIAVLLLSVSANAAPQQTRDPFTTLQTQFRTQQLPALQKFCLDCHSATEQQGDLDLEQFRSVADIRRNPVPWQRAVELLDQQEMPPQDAEHQPSPAERQTLKNWIQAVLDADARANAGDPGPVVLRRLNNAELTATIHDLTGQPLSPASQFPVDSAAGEGFTNVGNSLVLSPALIQKYLDAARDVADHAMLLPAGIQFSPSTTARDWTNEKLAAIRSFYDRYCATAGGTPVNLQGVQFETNGGGRLPLERYLHALLSHREALRNGSVDITAVAAAEKLSPRYLNTLWNMLQDPTPSLLLDGLRQEFSSAQPADAVALTNRIAAWQQTLWRFTTIGHIGKRDGPKAWQIPSDPVDVRQEIRLPIPATSGTFRFWLATADAGDGHEHDVAVWSNPRFTAPGQPDLLLRDVRRAAVELNQYRDRVIQTAAACLRAAAVVAAQPDQELTPERLTALAAEHAVDVPVLSSWLSLLGIGTGEAVVSGHLKSRMERAESYDFVKGWTAADALSVIANSSDQLVRVPGDARGHGVCVHPSPTIRAVVGWQSPQTAAVTVRGRVQRAHLACGNGVTWIVELRRGTTRQRLAEGTAAAAEEMLFGPLENLAVRKGDVIALSVGPRDNNHSCDLTAVDLTITATAENIEWDLGRDVSPDILAGNPHPDLHGNNGVWHFYGEPDSGVVSETLIAADSLLDQWRKTELAADREKLATELQQLLAGPADAVPADSPDGKLRQQLIALNGPLFATVRREVLSRPADAAAPAGEATSGPDPQLFGRLPDGTPIAAADLCVNAPSVLEIEVPADLVPGSEFVATAGLQLPAGAEGSVQMQVLTAPPDSLTAPAATTARPTDGKARWSDGEGQIRFDRPILVQPESNARARLLRDFDTFRQLFPAALCYHRIVPVDEVVTLTLYYREDDHLRRLMLSDDEAAELDRLWADMHFVSRSALALVDAYEQLWQFATQDADPSAFTPMREGILKNAELFREQQRNAEPVHLQAVLDIADRAWRRHLTENERNQLNSLYQQLRTEGLDHEASIRKLLVRVFVSPAFLFRTEQVQTGTRPASVSAPELASRLSYFLWSSLPDQTLRQVADSDTLRQDDELRAQLTRMRADPRIRRMAIEFGCQWLHIRDFDQLDEKSTEAYPEFAELRGDMYEESILFLEDLLRNDRSILSLLDADHTWVNARLAKFYGLEGIEGDHFRRVDGLRASARGGILAMASTLAKQSGASRTSPILRGNWVSEFLLGDRLPKPPKGVPVLPESAPANVTERQLIELHSSDPACARCHQRIDPFGFALEGFDTIGRLRNKDAHGLEINTAAVLPDGTPITGLDGLRQYLLQNRRRDFVRTFCRRLLGYALGRSTQLSDEPLLDEMLVRLEQNEWRIGVALETIVLSPQFRTIRGADQQLAVQED